MKLKSLCFALCLITISGCTIHKEWVATDGSKADGTVTLVYEYPSTFTPETKHYQAEKLAREKCQDWGYKDAKAFGGGDRICVTRSFTRLCETYRVTMRMQCTGGFPYAY